MESAAGGAVALALAGIAVIFAPAAARAGFPGKNGRIAYDSQYFIAGKYGATARSIVTFQLGRPTSDRTFPACSGRLREIVCDGAGDPAYAPDGRHVVAIHCGAGPSASPDTAHEQRHRVAPSV
jgi:hypothetical protein